MGWCREHLQNRCVFGEDELLRAEHCPEVLEVECTLVQVMLTVHKMPGDIRRKLIAALYPAYGIASDTQPSALPGITMPVEDGD
jgi:hypothetical protein